MYGSVPCAPTNVSAVGTMITTINILMDVAYKDIDPRIKLT